MKSGNIEMDEARALVGDKALWPRVRDFLWDFVPQIHPSWLDGGIVAPMDNPRVKRHILEGLGVEPFFHMFPKDDWSRLALLDGGTLEALSKWIGAIVFVDRLRGVTAGAEVRALKSALPGVYPDVFAFAAYFERFKPDGAAPQIDGSLADAVILSGRRLMFSFLAVLPAQLRRRVELKLPRPQDEAGGDAAVAETAYGVDARFLTKLLKLKFPEAYKLCCC